MLTREKIKLLRQSKKWSQEYLAEKLGMSANGYGEIERGKSRMTIEKLEELAQLFDVPVSELCNEEKMNVFIAHNIGNQSQQNNQSDCTIFSHSEQMEMKHELEKMQLFNDAKDREIEMYKQKVADLTKVIELLERNQK